MLNRIRLRNFQCHEDLKIAFDPNVTTIIGRSDIGKSAIIRALRWITFNRPAGDAFIRHGYENTIVSLWVDDACICRKKGDANELRIGGDVFKAFGSDVPEPVSALLNLGHVNYQLQHEAPFWFSLTPGQVSRELNSVVNLDVIDKTLAEIASRVRKSRDIVGLCQERLEEAEEEVERLNFVTEMEGEYEEIEKGNQELGELEDEVDYLSGLVEKIEEADVKRSQEIPDLLELEKLQESDFNARRDISGLNRLVEQIERQVEMLEDSRSQLKRAKEELRRKSKGRCPLCGAKLGERI